MLITPLANTCTNGSKKLILIYPFHMFFRMLMWPFTDATDSSMDGKKSSFLSRIPPICPGTWGLEEIPTITSENIKQERSNTQKLHTWHLSKLAISFRNIVCSWYHSRGLAKYNSITTKRERASCSGSAPRSVLLCPTHTIILQAEAISNMLLNNLSLTIQ